MVRPPSSFKDTANTKIYTRNQHDALPIYVGIDKKTWAFDPSVLRICGPTWMSWSGPYLGLDDSLWVDPFRLDPFVTTSVWLESQDFTNSRSWEDTKAITVGYATPTPGIAALDNCVVGATSKTYDSGGAQPTAADFEDNYEIFAADVTTVRHDNRALGFSGSGGYDSVIPGFVPDSYSVLAQCAYGDGGATDVGGITTALGPNDLHDMCNGISAYDELPCTGRTPQGVYLFTQTTQEVLPSANQTTYHPVQIGQSGTAVTQGPQFVQVGLATRTFSGEPSANTNAWSGLQYGLLTGAGHEDWLSFDARAASALTAYVPATTMRNWMGLTSRWMSMNSELITRSTPFACATGSYGGADPLGVGEFKFNGEYLIGEKTDEPPFTVDSNFWLRYAYGVPFSDERKYTHLFEGGRTQGPCVRQLGSLYYGNTNFAWGANASFVNLFDTNGVNNVHGSRSSMLWHSHGALTSHFLHERDVIPNPWDRASEGEPGIKTYTYVSSQQPEIARALVLRLRSRYQEDIASGLTNELMRDIQVVN